MIKILKGIWSAFTSIIHFGMCIGAVVGVLFMVFLILILLM